MPKILKKKKKPRKSEMQVLNLLPPPKVKALIQNLSAMKF